MRHRHHLIVNSGWTESCFSGTSSEFYPFFSPFTYRQQSSLNERESMNKSIENPEKMDVIKNEKAPDNSTAQYHLPDPPILTWFDAIIPSKFTPYVRLSRMDKPIGTMLLVRLLL